MFPTIVQAPMAGGATTPELVHAVSTAGGFGFLAAGYLSSAQLEENIAKTKALGTSSFGVNLFVPSDTAHLVEEVNSYETKMQKLAKKLGTEAGTPRYSDDEWDEKFAYCSRSRFHTFPLRSAVLQRKSLSSFNKSRSKPL